MFPPYGAQIDYSEYGEPMGWDTPADFDSYYCDDCGCAHFGECPDPYEYEDD